LLIERRDPAQGAVLRAWLSDRVLPTFADRVLPIDTDVARRCAALHVPDPRTDRGCAHRGDGAGAWHDGRDAERGRLASTGVPVINPRQT
jgi:toxin FitB